MSNIENLNNFIKKTEENQSILLGFEYDNDEDNDENEEKLYNVDDIRITTKVFSLDKISRDIDRGRINLQPEYQRNDVWNDKKKSLLIESLMLRIPLPGFYFDEDINGNFSVIDGLQRLTAINKFLNNEYCLKGLQYLTKCNNKRFKELDRKYTDRIEDAQLSINIMDSSCPELAKFDVFRRINTEGVRLNPQEIRNIKASKLTRKLLKDMAESDVLRNAVNNSINDIRMSVREMCLLFIVYYKNYDIKNCSFMNFKEKVLMLDEMIIELNNVSSTENITNRKSALYLL